MTPTYSVRVYGLGLRIVERRDGHWSLETVDFERLRGLIGDELLCAFLRLFVWTDRASSLLHLGYWSIKNLPEGSPALERDIQTVVWFASGLLFEAADAIEQLQAAGIADHLGTKDHWSELQAMADRWTKVKLLRRARNNIGFHAARPEMLKGIATLAAKDDRLIIMESDSTTTARSTFRLGLEALLIGVGASLKEFDELIETIKEDWGRFPNLVQYLFMETLHFHEAIPEGPPPDA
jgi:hypothetical protein